MVTEDCRHLRHSSGQNTTLKIVGLLGRVVAHREKTGNILPHSISFLSNIKIRVFINGFAYPRELEPTEPNI